MLIRGHHELDGQFTQVPNAWLRDPGISLGAKGLIAQLMSHTPGWVITIQNLAKQNNCGKDRIRTYIRELQGAGYLFRSEQQRHNDKGYLVGYDYITQDPPLAGLSLLRFNLLRFSLLRKNPHLRTLLRRTLLRRIHMTL